MPAAWGRITAGEILFSTNGKKISGDSGKVLSGISTDSRSIHPGELFWALKGERFDGHDFVLKAIENGAAGIVVQKDWRNSEVVSKILRDGEIGKVKNTYYADQYKETFKNLPELIDFIDKKIEQENAPKI